MTTHAQAFPEDSVRAPRALSRGSAWFAPARRQGAGFEEWWHPIVD